MASDTKPVSHVLRAKIPFDLNHADDARFQSLMHGLDEGEMPRLLRHLLLKAMPQDAQAFEEARASAAKEQQERGIRRGRPNGAQTKVRRKSAKQQKQVDIPAAPSDAVAAIAEAVKEVAEPVAEVQAPPVVSIPAVQVKKVEDQGTSRSQFAGLIGGSTWN